MADDTKRRMGVSALLRSRRCYVIVAWLLALTIGFTFPLSGGDWLIGHGEGLRYLALGEYFREAIAQTGVQVRWLPSLHAGYGYPTFVYYQPLMFWLYALWSPFFSVTGAMLAAVGSGVLVGTLGAYLLARRFGDAFWGAFVAALFMLSPYLYVNAYVRQDLSELLSMLLLPWVLLGIALIGQSAPRSLDRYRGGLILAVAYAAVVYAHPITGVLTPLGCAPLVLSLVFRRGDGATWRGPSWDGARRTLTAGFGFFSGLLLSAPYWLPFQAMKGEVWLENAKGGNYEAARHTAQWSQLFGRFWGFGGSAVDNIPDGMPLQLGATHCALALGSAWLGRKRPLVVGLALSYAAVVIAISPAGAPLWRLPVFDQMQFPWRAFTLTTALQVALVASAGPALARHLRGPVPRLAVYGAVLLAVTAWQWPQFRTAARAPNATAQVHRLVGNAKHQVQTYAGTNEFLPKTSRRAPTPRGEAPIVAAANARVTFQASSNDYKIDAIVRAQRPTVVEIRQFFLPGWVVMLDGKRLGEDFLRDNLAETGTMRVPLQPATPGQPQDFSLQAYYSGPRGQSLGRALALLAAATLAGLGVGAFRRR